MHSIIATSLVSAMVTFSPPMKPVTPERLTELVKKLEETKPQEPFLNGLLIHSPAVAELGRAGPNVVATLISIYENKKSSSAARAHAACALAIHLNGIFTIPDPGIVRVLKAAMKDEDPIVRRGILLSTVNWYRVEPGFESLRKENPDIPPLHAITFPEATFRMFLPEIVEGLGHSSGDIAAHMAGRLYLFAEPNIGVKELIDATKRPERDVRARAITALGRVGRESPEALRVVLQFLGDKSEPQVFRAAVHGIGWFGPKAKDAVPSLIKVVESSEFKYQMQTDLYEQAISSLGQIGPDAKAAVPTLIKYARVRHQSSVMLCLIDSLQCIDREAAKEVIAICETMKREFRDTNSNPMLYMPGQPFIPQRP